MKKTTVKKPAKKVIKKAPRKTKYDEVRGTLHALVQTCFIGFHMGYPLEVMRGATEEATKVVMSKFKVKK